MAKFHELCLTRMDNNIMMIFHPKQAQFQRFNQIKYKFWDLFDRECKLVSFEFIFTETNTK